MQQKYIWGVLVVLLLVIVGVTAFSRSTSTTSPIKIGAILSLTGNGAAYGEPVRDGALLAVGVINKAGGVNGRPIELVLEDSQFDAKMAVSTYQSLAARGVHLFLSNGSSVSLALRPLAIASENLLFEGAAVTPTFTDDSPLTCRATLTAVPSTEALAAFAATTLHAKRVASLTLNDDYGGAVRDWFKTAAEKRGLSVTMQEVVNKDETDIRSHVAKLKAREKDIDALVVVPIAAQAQPVLQQLHELGWSKPILSDNFTIINQSLHDLSLAEGVYFSNYDWSQSEDASDAPNVAAFKQSFSATYHYAPPAIAGNGYDAVMLIAKALKETKSEKPNVIATYLTTQLGPYQGVTGNFTMNQTCESLRQAVVNQVKSGQFVPVVAPSR